MWQRRHPNFDDNKWIDCTKEDAEKFGPGGVYGGWEIREMPSMARNEALLCRLMNARSIAFDRLPRADVQAIHDAIDALKQSELVKIGGEEYAVHPVVAAELLRLHMAAKQREPSEVEKLMDAAGLCRRCAAPTQLKADEAAVIQRLLDLARQVDHALDDSEEVNCDGYRSHNIAGQDFDDVVEALDALEDLPDNKPGMTLGPAGKAEWALRRLLQNI